MPGEEALLLNYEHLSTDSPYRACHAIYVRRAAREAYDRVNEVPPALATRASTAPERAASMSENGERPTGPRRIMPP